LGSYTRALLVSQDRRLFVPPGYSAGYLYNTQSLIEMLLKWLFYDLIHNMKIPQLIATINCDVKR